MKKPKPEHNAVFMDKGYSGGLEMPFETSGEPGTEPAKDTKPEENPEGDTE